MVSCAPLIALLLAFSGTALAAENSRTETPAAEPPVGVATMLQNGTILVGVRERDSDVRAGAVLMVEPGDTTYQRLLDHLGGLKPGETKSIPPWPDSAPKKDGTPADPNPGA
jgi:hypothetical protein